MTATIHPIHPMYETLDLAYDNWRAHRFDAWVVQPDGSGESFAVHARSSIDAATLAMERGGLGSVVKVHRIDPHPCTASNDINRSLSLNNEFEAEEADMLAALARNRVMPERAQVELTPTMVQAMDEMAGLCEPAPHTHTPTQETPK